MKVPKKGRLQFFKDLYEEAKALQESAFEELDKWYNQYKGDPSIDPLPGEEGINSPMQATVVRNITYELIESQNTTYIPSPKCDALSYSERSARCAMSAEKYLNSMRNALPVEELNDIDERMTYIYGGSVWLVEWDNSIKTHNTVGSIKLSCLSPRRFIGQPYIYRIEDMEYCFIEFETTKEDLVRRFDISYEKAEDTANDQNQDEDTATMYVCYYKDENDNVCQYIWSNEVELLNLEDYYSRKREYCVRCGKKKELCECEEPEIEVKDEEYEELTEDIVLTDGKTVIPAQSPMYDEEGNPVMEDVEMPVTDEMGQALSAFDEASGLTLPLMEPRQIQKTEATKLPFYKPKSFPVVIRKNTSREGSVLGQSDCEFIRPQQQAINKVESRIMQKLMKAGVTPYIPEDANITPNNSVFGQVIRVRPGEAGQYGVIDTQVNIQLDIIEADRLYDQAKRVLGISESFQGHYDPSAKSGVAKQTQAMQSSGRLDSKRKMKNFAWSQIDRIMFELLLAFADEPRPAAYVDSYGYVQEVSFSRYDFLVQDEEGKWYYDDSYLFSADASVDMSTDRATMWAENLANFEKGTYGDPKDPKTQLMYWLNQQKAHYPFAQENVERIKAVIAEQAQIAQMQQMMAAQQEQIAALQGEADNRAAYGEHMYNVAKGLERDVKDHESYESYVADEIKKYNEGR